MSAVDKASEIVRVEQVQGRAVVSASFGLAGFRNDFAHCSATADLFTQVCSSALGSHSACAEDLSTALNEMLEWAYGCGVEQGELALQVSESESVLQICVTVPMPPEPVVGEVERVTALNREHARERFVLELAKPMRESSSLLGLYWLACEYGRLHALREPARSLRLALDMGP